MWIKRIIQTVAFCAVLAFGVNQVYDILSWKDTAGEYYSSVDSFYGLEEDLIDVLFLGSSHCYCSINNSVMWNDYGISNFSLAISGQDLASTYFSFKEALKTQTPEVVCVEVFGAAFDGYQIEGNRYRNILPFKLSKNSFDAVMAMVEEEKRMDYLLRWPIIHTRYKELKKADFTEPKAYIGYQSEFKRQGVEELVPYKGRKSTPMSESGEKWLKAIIALAEENNIELCFFVAPYVAPEQEQMVFKSVEKIAKEHDIPYLNMIEKVDELVLDRSRDFIDWMHTNYYGALKVTDYMGSYLKDNYKLADHRGDSAYELWEGDLLVRQKEVSGHIKRDTDINDYLATLGVVDNYTIVITTDGEYLAEGFDLMPQLSQLGIGEEYYEGNYIWVISNGEVIFSSDAMIWEKFDLDGTLLEVSRSEEMTSIVVDSKDYIKVTDGINVVVYDNLLGKVADAVGFVASIGYGMAR